MGRKTLYLSEENLVVGEDKLEEKNKGGGVGISKQLRGKEGGLTASFKGKGKKKGHVGMLPNPLL